MKNKKPNQKRTLKDKIKSFFTISKKDLEEEPFPKFEKVNLFTLTKNKLFFGILAFLLLINILVGFDISQFYIRAILSFIFLITIPGLLIMLMMKIREVGFWEYLVYVVGLSISFIMFGGLAVNWILPWLNITDKPLSLYPTLICFNVFLIAFWIIAWIRNKDLKSFEITMPKLDWINRIFFIVPMVFPILSILGAFLLNNHGTNILTMIMLGGIAVYVFMIVLFRKKLNRNVFPWAILMIGLSLLMMGWMRSWFISGVDVSNEFYIFNLVKQNFFWNIEAYNISYNFMLSLGILPNILSIFTSINPQFLFKIFFPLIFSFVPIIIFLISKKYFNPTLSFFSSFFFLLQPIFAVWMAIPFRQHIAFLFFGLFILILLNKNTNKTMQKILILIFAFAVVVSHYSTTYILILFLVLFIFLNNLPKKNIKKVTKSFTIVLLFLILLFSFLWYAQLTTTSDGLENYGKKSFGNLKNFLKEDVQAEGASFKDHLAIFTKKVDLSKKFDAYYNNTISNINNNLDTENKYPVNLKNIISSTSIKNISFYRVNLYIDNLLLFSLKIILFFGVLYLLFYKKRDFFTKEILILFAGFLIICFLFFLPYVTVNYDFARAYQQLIIFLCPLSIFGFMFLVPSKNKKLFFIILSVLFILYFLYNYGFLYEFSGNYNQGIYLENNCPEYFTYYSHRGEIVSYGWLYSGLPKSLVHIGDRANNRARLSDYYSHLDKKSADLIPLTIQKDSYVFGSYANKNYGIVFKSYQGNQFSYNFPTQFLHDNKNKIYNNGGSEIFK